MDLFKVISVDEVKKMLNEAFEKTVECEEVDIKKAIGRIISKDIVSSINLPSFRRSTVDGYAVTSRDTAGASESIPAIMTLKGEVIMGKAPLCNLALPGECVYVPTGGMLPEGSDAVVMIEYTDKLDEETILINSPVAYGDNVVQIGEDIKNEEKVLQKGTKLRPYEIGMLSSLGIGNVQVYKKPKIAIISTGDEIVGCDEKPKLGQVRDINSYILSSAVLEDGGEPINYGVIKDSFEDLKNTVDDALDKCDIVLISGGSSVGKKDQTLKVINALEESEVLVHGISIKPGKPTIIAKTGDKVVFGLPGHPLSCTVVYKVIVNHYINKITNYKYEDYPVLCKFPINYHSAKGREEYLPVILESTENGEIIANPVFSKSGLITGFTKAWGYVKINKNDEGIKEGQTVYAYKF
ncbi:gephyrin-like molybdotransferase Glp [Oceanirhabdus seepicola]|uniref:Molybdopterin molybdenumtransferase n=1 Tax=Oceanirhabdus seepicola TaxID=2828781 RepID=A0A9J6P6R8_9CLOT|nr:gephyrin-like molybdotransferase Glp [Oceanirhabdus seepicola]MCM1992546.1 molybdopterin molybdotransferase MoeA [Oceanirhabdus seepicola]